MRGGRCCSGETPLDVLRQDLLTNLLQTAPLPIAQSLLGHSTIRMTERCAPISRPARARAICNCSRSRPTQAAIIETLFERRFIERNGR
jgi:hypothetical protein